MNKKKILIGAGVAVLILVLGFMMFKIHQLENQKPIEKIVYINNSSSQIYSDKEIRAELENIKASISNLTNSSENTTEEKKVNHKKPTTNVNIPLPKEEEETENETLLTTN